MIVWLLGLKNKRKGSLDVCGMPVIFLGYESIIFVQNNCFIVL